MLEATCRHLPRAPAASSFIGLGLLLAALPILQPTAAACGGTDTPWIELALSGANWPRSLRMNLTADLGAGLRLRGFELCLVAPPSSRAAPAAGAGRKPPLARVDMSVQESERSLVRIEIHDAVTDKHVIRDVDLHAVSPDARGLILAQAADELLRASWLELALSDAPEPVQPPPRQIAEAIQRPIFVPVPGPVLGGRFAMEHYGGGISLFGADAFADFWLTRHLGASIAVGLRTGLPIDAPNGRIDSSAVQFGADFHLPLWPAEMRYNLGVLLGVQVANLAISGQAPQRLVRAYDRSALAANARLGVLGSWHIWSDIRLSAEVGAGLPLRTVSAADSGREVSSTSGLLLHFSLGVGGVL